MNKGLGIGLVISVLLVIGLTGRVIQLSINNYNLGRNYNILQSQISAAQTQTSQPSCQYWLDFMHNGEACPYGQSSSGSLTVN